MEITLNEMADLLRNGFIVSIIVSAVFYFVRFPAKMKTVYKNAITKLIILSVAAFYTYLIKEFDPAAKKEYFASMILTVSFSIMFYELAGKYVVQKFFSKYRGEETQKTISKKENNQ